MYNLCPKCAIQTDQIARNARGSDCVELLCKVCSTVTQRLSREDLSKKFAALLGSEPPVEISTANANTVKVFVEHHLGEAEMSLESVQEHIRLTGKLPEVGGSLYALPAGMLHKAFAIPIAKVLRVERCDMFQKG